jgi:hypothetical protein
MRMHEGRRDEIKVLPRQLQFLGKGGRRQHEDCGGCAIHGGGSAGQHWIVPSSGRLSSVGTLRRSLQASLRWNKLPVILRDHPQLYVVG